MSDNNDEDTACVICGGTNSTKKNQIVFCDGGADCNIAVHQKCYGIDVIPDADWLCQRCHDRISVSQTRAICCLKSLTGAFKRTDVPNRYIHVECAIWNKDIVHTKEPFHINTALVGAQKCHICNRTDGLCPQCQYGPGCTNYIHITCAIEKRTFNPRDKDVLVLCGDHLSAPTMSRSPSIGSSSSAVPATRGKRRRVRRVETDDEATGGEEEGDEDEEAEEEEDEDEDEDEDEEQVTDSDVSMGTTESAKAKSKSKEQEPVKAGVKRPRGRPRKESATSTLKATASNGTKARARPRDDDDDDDDNDSGSDDADLGSRMGDRRAPGVTALASSSTSAIRGKTIPTGAATTAQSSNKLKAMLASKRARKDSGGWQPNAVGPSPAAVGASSSVAPLVLSKSLSAKPPVTASSGASLSQVLPNVAGASVQVASPGAPTLQLQQQPLNTIIAVPLKRPSLAPAPSMVARANMSPNATPLSPGNVANVPTSTGFKRAGGGMGIGGGTGSGSGANGGPAAALDLDTKWSMSLPPPIHQTPSLGFGSSSAGDANGSKPGTPRYTTDKRFQLGSAAGSGGANGGPMQGGQGGQGGQGMGRRVEIQEFSELLRNFMEVRMAGVENTLSKINAQTSAPVNPATNEHVTQIFSLQTQLRTAEVDRERLQATLNSEREQRRVDTESNAQELARLKAELRRGHVLRQNVSVVFGSMNLRLPQTGEFASDRLDDYARELAAVFRRAPVPPEQREKVIARVVREVEAETALAARENGAGNGRPESESRREVQYEEEESVEEEEVMEGSNGHANSNMNGTRTPVLVPATVHMHKGKLHENINVDTPMGGEAGGTGS